MSNAMTQFRDTAKAHMARDLAANSHWECQCEACHEIRSLMGMDKALEVRRKVRELIDIEERLKQVQDGDEKRGLLEHYFSLYDIIADEMSR